jgi:hypothetical protein
MAALTELRQGSQMLVQYIDNVKQIRDEFEALEMKGSLPLLSQRFITGLSDELRISCSPMLHSVLLDKTKTLDDLIEQVRSMALLLPPSYASANTTRAYPSTSPRPNQRPDTRECNYCHRKGHVEAECRTKRYDQANGTYRGHSRQKPQQTSKFPQEKFSNAKVLCVEAQSHASIVSTADKSALWYDTMATHHIVCHEGLLANRRASFIHTVVIGGNEKHSVSCAGDLLVTGGPNGPVLFTNVLYVPTLHINLCSGPQFTNNGGESWQGGDSCKLLLGKKELLTGVKTGNMYKLQCTLPTLVPDDARCNSTSALWHNRFGHPGPRVLRSLQQKQQVTGLDKVKLSSDIDPRRCTTCSSAKQTRVTFARSDSIASKPVEILHSDLMFMTCEGLKGEKCSHCWMISPDMQRSYASTRIIQ